MNRSREIDAHMERSDEDGLEELLRQVGAREDPSAQVMNDVRQVVHGEWRAMLAERARRRRRYAYGLAASAVFALAMIAAMLRFTAPQAELMATIALIDGRPQSTARAAGDAALAVGDQLAPGEVVSTDEVSRLALKLGAGASVRIDTNSRVQLAAPGRFVLETGGIYVDVPLTGRFDRDPARELVVATHAGEVRHRGTQYQVRGGAGAVEFSVREGRIEVTRADGDALASAGELLRIAQDGSMERGSVPRHGPMWDWAVRAAPPFEIHDQPLDAFLQWVARETGRRVVYATSEAQRTSQSVRLRGSIEGLDPEAALAAVLSTTELRRYETNDELIGVALASQAD